MVGIWSFVPLVVIAVTGVVMSYPGVGDRVYPVVGAVMGWGWGEDAGEGLEGAGDGASPVPWRLPSAGPRMAEHRAHGPPSGPRAASRGFGDRTPRPTAEGNRAHRRPGDRRRRLGGILGDETPSHRAQELLRYAHTGEYWGLAGQALAGLFALAVVVLAWTGFTVALVMWRLRRGKRSG